MKLTRKRGVLLFSMSLGVAMALASLQAAAGATRSVHVKVTGRDFASQLSMKPLPDRPGVLSRRHEVWAGAAGRRCPTHG